MTPVKPQVSGAMTSAGDGLSACASSMTPQSAPSSLGVTWRTDAVDVQFLVRPSEVCGEDHDVLAVAGSPRSSDWSPAPGRSTSWPDEVRLGLRRLGRLPVLADPGPAGRQADQR